MQQLSLMAKELIIPPPGYGIVSADLSQIEFRVIVHYLENKRCLAAFQKNPWTDFHVWVANSVPTKRKPAKTLNFMLGYGGGMAKTVSVLSVNKELVGEIIAAIENDDTIPPDQKHQAMTAACERRAKKVYDGYHALLPELKPTTKQATAACQRKGYVRNHAGRRRHLPADIAWKAFNNVCQSTAGDLFKDVTVQLADEVPEFEQIASVHDAAVGLLPLDLLKAEAQHGDATLRRICNTMNSPSRPLRVPVRTSIGWSDRSWAEAQSEECEQKFSW
jgi:DNA polymerase I-like protein with 3'-5' exonuclease and polymerase domains